MVFRGEPPPGGTRPINFESLTNRQWMRVKGDSGLKAMIYGTSMTEEEAKEYAGDEWPEDND